MNNNELMFLSKNIGFFLINKIRKTNTNKRQIQSALKAKKTFIIISPNYLKSVNFRSYLRSSTLLIDLRKNHSWALKLNFGHNMSEISITVKFLNLR